MNFPENLKYTNDHEWVRFEGDTAYVGITDYAQSELGEIVYLDIPSEGEALEADEVFGSVEAVKTVSDLMMPVAGTVETFNTELEDNPQWVNEDPYGKGWIIRVNDAVEAEGLMDAEAYKAMING